MYRMPEKSLQAKGPNATKTTSAQLIAKPNALRQASHKAPTMNIKVSCLQRLQAKMLPATLKNEWRHESELKNAVLDNNLEKVESFLKNASNPNERDSYGNTLLHHAVNSGNIEMVSLLVKYHANPDLKNGSGDTVLHQVARARNTQLAALILPVIKNVNERNDKGYAAIHFAVSAEKSDFVQLLLAHKADLDIRDPHNNSPLHIAIHKRNTEITSLLLENGANPNLENDSRETPILAAICNDAQDILCKLLENGADPNLKHTMSQAPPLHFAILKNNTQAVKLLLQNKADPNIETPGKSTCAIAAVDKNNVEILELLVKAGADLTKSNFCGDTVLTTAAKKGNVVMLDSLLKFKIDINMPNTLNGKTALHMSCKNGLEQMSKYLVMQGADINRPDKDGNTPIFDVVTQIIFWWQPPKPSMEQSEIANFLLQKGADVNRYEADNFFIAKLADTLYVKYPGEARNFLYSRVNQAWEKLDSRRVDAILEQYASRKVIEDKDMDRLLLHLLHPDIHYKDDLEAARYTAHLRSWRGMLNREGKPQVEAEGWWTHVYPPLKMKSLIFSLNQVNQNQLDCNREFGISKDIVMKKLKHEIASQMSTYYTQRHHDMMRMISDVRFREEFKDKEAAKYCKEIVKTAMGTEWSMSSGFTGHALYIGFRKTDPDHVARIVYNLGAGLHMHPMAPDGKVFPHVVRNIQLGLFIEETPQAKNYIKGLIDAKLGRYRDPLPSIYADVIRLGGEVVRENIPGIPQKRQLAGNCVLKNNKAAERNRINNDRLFQWLKKEETKFADAMSEIHQDIVKEKEKEMDLNKFNYVINVYQDNKNIDIAMKNMLKFLEKRENSDLEIANHLREAERIAFYLQKMDEKTLDLFMIQKGALNLFSDIAELRYCETLKHVIGKYTYNQTLEKLYISMHGRSYGKYESKFHRISRGHSMTAAVAGARGTL